MPSYLLLRNNKQSGPLSQEQLLQLGLKPYDLVWIEGKSAAWRYPSEVPELKDHAPVVEEQPYDRFYKKQNDEQREQEQEQKPVAAAVENIYERAGEIRLVREEKYDQYMPKKAVSVIMPKQAAPVKKEEPVFIPAPAAPARVVTVAERPAEVETKYSQPLDEIKEMYVNQLKQRKHKTAQRKFVMQSLKKAAVFIAIIGSGVLIGFVIKPKHSSKNNGANPVLQNNSLKAVDATMPETEQTGIKAESAPVNDTKLQSVNSKNEVADNSQGANQVTIPENKNSISEKKNAREEKEESSGNQQSQSTIINTSGVERNKNSRIDKAENETNEKNMVASEDVSKFVSVKSNDYKIGTFGGVHNLELTVINDSKFVLENVMVELQYLKLSEQPVKIEHVRFQSIAPGGSLTIRVPDTNRGARLLYKIIKIESKDLNTAGL